MTKLCTDWITEADLELCGTIPSGASDAQKAAARTVASEILYSLSGSRWSGSCTETIRPCSSSAARVWPGLVDRYVPLADGTWWRSTPCGCHYAYDCGCTGIPQVNLGRVDVSAIDEVLIDGAVLDPSAYRLDHERWLVRVDGDAWPCCQDLTLDTSQEGTWSIALTYGRTPPTGGVRAAAQLALEMLRACVGSDACHLPERVQTVARQGVTMTLVDPQEFLTDGRTGLYLVDLWLAAVNPAGIRRRATAWSPDLGGRHRTETPAAS